jgi:hypothetical protein
MCLTQRDSDVIARFLHTIVALAVLVPASAQAQNDTNMSNSPSLRVVGFYSFNADATAYSRFIQNEIASSDPANFSEDVKEKLRRLGRDPQPYTDEDRQEEENLRFHMDNAAVFEVMVTNPDVNFDIGKFVQPDPAQSENFWQMAWNEKFLTPDGETPIDLNRTQKLPDASQYRVVFVIHFWKPNLPLRSSYGELTLPAQLALPERLWRLTPYETPG